MVHFKMVKMVNCMLCILQFKKRKHSKQKTKGFPGGASGKEPACRCQRLKTGERDPRRARSLGQEDPLEEGKAATPASSPEESQGQKNLMGYSPQGHKESDMTEATWHTHPQTKEQDCQERKC